MTAVSEFLSSQIADTEEPSGSAAKYIRKRLLENDHRKLKSSSSYFNVKFVDRLHRILKVAAATQHCLLLLYIS